MERLGNTQNIPTQKSATARLARKKLVMLLSRGLLVIANSTIKFPESVKKT